MSCVPEAAICITVPDILEDGVDLHLPHGKTFLYNTYCDVNVLKLRFLSGIYFGVVAPQRLMLGIFEQNGLFDGRFVNVICLWAILCFHVTTLCRG